MSDISDIRNFKLKGIFMLHFTLIAFSLMGYWTSTAYVFYNFIFILTLIWAIKDHDNGEPIQLSVAINGISFILDIFLLILGFPDSYQARERISVALAIIHLIIRPISTLFLIKILEERGGIPETGITSILPRHRNQGSYENIDEGVPHPGQSGGYDISSAQRI